MERVSTEQGKCDTEIRRRTEIEKSDKKNTQSTNKQENTAINKEQIAELINSLPWH